MPVDDTPRAQAGSLSGGGAFASALGRLYDSFLAAYEGGDAAALVSLYTEDAALIEPDKSPIHGRDGIAANLREWFEHYRFSSGRWEIWELEVLGDTAWDLSYFEMDATRLKTGDTFREQWKQLCIWRQQAHGAWRLHRLMFNSHRVSDPHDRS